jgi:hypothetical protein
MVEMPRPPHEGGVGAEPARIRPARWWYWVALAAFVVAAAWGVLGLFWFFAGGVENLERIPIPGQRELTLGEAGDYVIYYEGPGAGQGVVLSSFDVTLTPTDGKPPPAALSRYQGTLSYTVGSNQGFAVFTFEIDEPRTFLFELAYGGEGPLPSQVAVGTSLAPALVATVVGFIALFLAALVIALVVFIRRRRARQTLRAVPTPGVAPG